MTDRIARSPFPLPFAAILGALCLLQPGCGSKPAETASAPTSQATSAPSGPCDEQHREQAVLAATAAARKAVGNVELGEPDANFLARYDRPQMPGQPAAEPTWGWSVAFTVPAPAPRESGDGAPTRLPAEAAAPVLSAPPTQKPADLAPPAAMLATVAQTSDANGVALPPSAQSTQAQIRVDADRSDASGSPAAPPRSGAMRTRTIVVFVAVDGTARLL